MNKITVVGRVCQAVELKNLNGRNVANFNVASNNKHKIGDQNGRPTYGTNFYRVSAWGQAADVASKYLQVGHRVSVSGDLVIRDYVSQQDGQKHTVVEINNAEVELIETRAEAAAKTAAAPVQQPVYTANPVAAAPAQNFTPVENVYPELPF